MTLSTTKNREQYNGDGVLQNFPYTFLVLDSSHLVVYVDDVIVANYSLTGIENPAGGEVQFDSAPPTGTGNVVFLRQVPLTQLVDYEEYDPFPAETHEGALDYLTMISQQQQEEIDRSLKWGATETEPTELTAEFESAVDRANDLWAFDSTGLIVVNVDRAEDKAYRWAEEDENVVVENRAGRDRYSAYHWAQKAAAISEWGLATKGDIYVGDGSLVPATVLPIGADGQTLVIDSAEAVGLKWQTQPQVLPGLSVGDKLKLLQVNVAEDGYELTNQYSDILVHAADMLDDDESGGTTTAIAVSHYSNTARQFSNPGPDPASSVTWINGVALRRIDEIARSLRLRIVNPIGDTSANTTDWRATAYLHYFGNDLGGPGNPGLTPVTVAGVALLGTDLNAVDVTFLGLIPKQTGLPVGIIDVMLSVKIERIAGTATHTGAVDLIVGLVELET